MERNKTEKMEGKLTDHRLHHCVSSQSDEILRYLFGFFCITMIPIQSDCVFLRLIEPDLSIQTRIEMAVEIRDSPEIINKHENLNFLECYFKASSVILHLITKPQFTDNLEHKLRNIVLETLLSLSLGEVILPFDKDLLKVAIHVLTTDNEENGSLSIGIIFHLLESVGPTLEDEVQPFLVFVCKIYQNFGLTVSHFFENVEMDEQLNPSTRSFRIFAGIQLVEVLMSLFPLLRHSRLVLNLLPLMVDAISIPRPENVSSHMKVQFNKLKKVQVMTVSFLTYLLKSGVAEYMRPYEESICKSIANLLVTCSDSESVRMMRELLVSLKYVLGTDWSSRFVTKEMTKVIVENSLRDKKKVLDKKAELRRVKAECQSLRLSEARLVAKSKKLEGEKTQKEVEVQKLIKENVKQAALLDRKEAQLLALEEQCKIMALNASNL